MKSSQMVVGWVVVLAGSVLAACGGVSSSPIGKGDDLLGEAGAGQGEGGSSAGTGGTTSPPGGTQGLGGSGAGTAGGPAEPVVCPCSRRPGVNNSFKCPIGYGESITQVIGPLGGEVLLQAQQGATSSVGFRIEVPPNALTEEVEITITATTDAPPADLVDYSPIFVVEPSDIAVRFPMKLTVPYAGNDGEISRSLAIRFAADATGPFEPIADYYVNAGFLQGSTTQFGAFLAAAVRTPEQAECP